MKTQLTVNKSSLVNNLRHAFTKRSNVISELMQNSRRAGATEIHFKISDDKIVIDDDGVGIGDFDLLLTIATSGWDVEIMQKESPFGLGFLAALYSCELIQVQSRGMLLEAETQDILDLKKIELGTSLVHKGTMVTLIGHKYPMDDLLTDIERLSSGFPIRVFCNNKEMSRPHAIENLVGTDTSIGFFHLSGIHDEETDLCSNTNVYLQGLPIKYNGDSKQGLRNGGECFLTHLGNYKVNKHNILHLDSEKYKARVPDRDVLIKPDELETDMGVVARECTLKCLAEEKSSFSQEDFIRRRWRMSHDYILSSHGHLAKGFNAFFNDVDLVPGVIFQTVTDYPYLLKVDEDCEFMDDYGDEFISRESLLTDKFQLFKIETLESSSDTSLLIAYMYAMKKPKALMIKERTGIHSKHWIHSFLEDVKESSDHFTYKLINESKISTFTTGNYIGPVDVQFCEKCIITHKGTKKRSTIIDSFVLPNYKIALPISDHSAHVISQLNQWSDGSYSWLSSEQEEEENLFSIFLHSELCKESKDLLFTLLDSASVNKYPRLYGKKYLVAFSEDGEVSIS